MQRIRQINFFFKTIVFNRKLISLPKIQQLETTMLARDLIATVIKTFFEELDDVRDGKRQMNDESPYAGMYASYFNKDRDWFIQADTEEINLEAVAQTGAFNRNMVKANTTTVLNPFLFIVYCF